MAYRSENYLNYVRGHACCVCGAPPRNDAHHFAGRRGMAVKASDAFTVPLCRLHHDEWHRRAGCNGMGKKDTMELFWRTSTYLLAAWLQATESLGEEKKDIIGDDPKALVNIL